MKIRKTAKLHIATAMILSGAFLFAGCGTNASKDAAPDAVEEETSNNENLVTENDIKEENQNKDIISRSEERRGGAEC